MTENKINTPQKVQEEKKLSELSKEEVIAKLTSFKEILGSDKFKDIDVVGVLGINPAPQPDARAVELTSKYKALIAEFAEAGVPLPKTAKMSEIEHQIHERVEKQARAKFSEQKQEILAKDPDFPVKLIEDLETSTDDKVALMAAAKEIVNRNVSAIAKLKEEIDKLNSEIKGAKFRSPQDESVDKAGEEIVKQALAKYGMKLSSTEKVVSLR